MLLIAHNYFYGIDTCVYKYWHLNISTLFSNPSLPDFKSLTEMWRWIEKIKSFSALINLILKLDVSDI